MSTGVSNSKYSMKHRSRSERDEKDGARNNEALAAANNLHQQLASLKWQLATQLMAHLRGNSQDSLINCDFFIALVSV